MSHLSAAHPIQIIEALWLCSLIAALVFQIMLRYFSIQRSSQNMIAVLRLCSLLLPRASDQVLSVSSDSSRTRA